MYVRLTRCRLKFTVVSEPMDDDDEEEECVDVGHASLDLQELLLTGNDVLEQEIDSRSIWIIFLFSFPNSRFWCMLFHIPVLIMCKNMELCVSVSSSPESR